MQVSNVKLSSIINTRERKTKTTSKAQWKHCKSEIRVVALT